MSINGFNGTIPSQIGRLTNLKILCVPANVTILGQSKSNRFILDTFLGTL
jgi:hypothetical protein